MNEVSPLEAIFFAALEKDSPQERAAYLKETCAGDPDLCRRVEKMLAAQAQAGSFLEQPARSPIETVDDQPIREAPGTVIGPYKLLQVIGEGGMGTVFMAEQTRPVQRKVALKVIKPGMDSRQVIARFEAERQALALMDHVNIARVFDGGATEAGRPFFVMELVHGIPITKYCDDNHLTPRQRLELFVPVCQAIQHAHQKGIIHRDVKPSNVMVTRYDGKPVPKVIDFGVAKATGQQLTDKTLVTGFGAIVGTLEYMSPEQAELNQLDIDTRSDIYSLGVLLYELLTGSTPFTKKDLEPSGMLEMLRVIREQEPSKPSTKLSTAEGLPTLAANRGTEPAKLTKLVRGELDWIVMKALEKDRSRRYETANGFAGDVQRYLADEPVLACPPSATYRLKKFVRRNKGQVLTAAAVLVALLAGIIGTSTALVWAVRERDDKAKALDAETTARRAEKQARDQALTALRDMTDEVVERQMARGANLTDENKEFLRKIIKQFEGFAALTADDADSRAIRAEGYYRVGRMRYRLGELKDAESAYDAAVAIWKQLAADFPTRPEFRHELARTHDYRGVLLHQTGRTAEAESTYGTALAIQKQLAADSPNNPDFLHGLANTHNCLGNVFRETGRLPKAESAYRAALTIQKKLAPDFPKRPEFRQGLARTHYNLGSLYIATGRLKEVESAYGAALDIRKQLAADFPTSPDFQRELATSHHFLGYLLQLMGRLPEAKSAYGTALDIRKQLAANFPTSPEFRQELARSHNDLGCLLYLIGRRPEGKSAWDAAVAIQKQLAADFPKRPEFLAELARSHNNQGILLSALGRLPEAELAYGTAIAIQKQLAADFPKRPEFRLELARSHNNLGILLKTKGRLPEAELAYGAALAIKKQLAADFPDIPMYRQELASTFVNLARVGIERRDFQAAKGYGEAAETHQLAALKANPRNPDYRGRYRQNIGLLVEANAGLRDQTAAVRAAERIRDLGGDAPGNAYFAAFSLSRCIPIVEKADKATREERDKQVRFYAAAAMAMLRDAVAKGFRAAAQLKKDNNFDPLRGREDFQKLLRAIELDPKDCPGYSNLALALVQSGDPKRLPEALAAARKAIELDSKSANAYNILGVVLAAQNERDDAIAAYQKAIDLNPKVPHAHTNLGTAFARQRKYDQAIASCRTALQINPKDIGAYITLGISLRHQKELDAAIDAFRKAIKLVPKYANAHYNLGNALRDQGKWPEAIAAYRKAVELDPKNAEAHYELAWRLTVCAELKLREPNQALVSARRAVQLDRKNRTYWQGLGYAEYRSGNWKAAILAFEKVKELGSPGDSIEWFPLAMAHWRLGDKDTSRKIYDEAVRWREKNNPRDRFLRSLQAEAAELMGIEQKKE